MPLDPPTTLCMFYIRSLFFRLLSDVLQATNALARVQATASYVRRTNPHSIDVYPPPPSSISGSAPDVDKLFVPMQNAIKYVHDGILFDFLGGIIVRWMYSKGLPVHAYYG